ncbi:hypothetical protein HNR60_001700 [Rhodopseudomonas rhenobacensis]|uniref:Uncharacterized protein n=1 Tax=Rhodopseudomonas rhenobacensis TaxID=87461 RepID=A0A7W7Z2V4_9BRAD|nr:hypothetical protein [Rhodopseudomonas rhenobacensis]
MKLLWAFKPWREVVGFAGFAIILPAVSGSADPCSGAVA